MEVSDELSYIDSNSEVVDTYGERNAVYGDNGGGGFVLRVAGSAGTVRLEAIAYYADGKGNYPSYCSVQRDGGSIVSLFFDNAEAFQACQASVTYYAIAVSAPCYTDPDDTRECVDGEIRS